MPTQQVSEADPPAVGGASGDPVAGPEPTGRPPWFKSWRMGLALLIIVPTFIGQIVGTDDAWPFAPFRMFASPTRLTTSIVHPEFTGYFADGTTRAMFSTDFHIRPAEVESELTHSRHLRPDRLADLARSYNRLHRGRPLVALDLRMVGQRIVDGRPDKKVDQFMQRWGHR